MNSPQISVVMPVYNAGGYLKYSIESILNQTFKDFEFIIINDGSTDDSESMIKHYQQLDSRIILISRENKGLVITLNEGIEKASAKLIARMDADDISLPRRLESQKDFMDTNPNCVAVGSKVRVIDQKSRFLTHTKPKLNHDEILNSALNGVCPLIHPSVMFRKEAVLSAGGYRLENYPAEDLALWLDLSHYGRLENIDEVLLEYRIHNNSISTQNHALQTEATEIICRRECEKRGIKFENKFRKGREDGSRSSKNKILLKHGWWAHSNRQWRTSAIYALNAIRQLPFDKAGWNLLFCSFLRRF
ncbi:glycosyltransferase [Methylophaga sp.]|uniref:glycosyltransferase n=1 Tax=Methylophaga sp. TaxID=2024840 RepID=UPI002725EB5E|nr:glycosyltransferase [Methylophaga sp.]MDO8825451.1 glycosyltransferase [Methylophaga sp.]